MSSGIYLETERVSLRQFVAGDEPLLLDLDGDPEVMRYLTGGKPSTGEEVAQQMERILGLRKKFSDRLGVFVAEEKAGGQFMGWFLLRPEKTDPENTRDLELGYRLKRKFWGQGYATEVSQALLDLAFRDLRAESVFAKTLVGNLGSRRVMEKIGLRYEGERLEPEHRELGPAAVYRIRREELEKAEPTR